MSEPLPRPRQVTTAAWIIMIGSLFVLVTVFERVAGVNDLETREAIQQFLSEPPGDDLGLDVPTVQALIRVFSMVAGACAAAAAILGFHVLRRHKGARLALTVLAVPLFLSGIVAGGFLSSLVAASAVMLWLEPSRDWFAGRAPRAPERRPEPEQPERPRDPHDGWPPVTPAATPPSAEPRAVQGFGTPTAEQPASPAWGAPAPASPSVAAHLAAPSQRPGAVVAAAVVTWVFAGIAGLLMFITGLLMLASPDLLLDEMNRQRPDLFTEGITRDTMRTATLVMAGVTAVWSAAAITAAIVMVVRRKRWARTVVLVSAAATGALCLLSVFTGALMMAVPMFAATTVLGLLLRPDVRAWVAAR